MPETETREPANMPDETYYRQADRSIAARRWGGILLLIGIVWMVFLLTSQSRLVAGGFGAGQTEPLPAQTFEGQNLVVIGVNDPIDLTRAAGSGITVEATRHGFGWNADAAREAARSLDLQITRQGDTVRVEVRRPSARWTMGRAPYIHLRIAVPAGVRLDIQTTNGDLTARGIDGAGVLQTVNGDIDARDTRGDLTFRTTNGDINVTGHSGPASFATTNGDIELRNGSAGPLSAQSVNGDMKLSGVTGRIELRTISGDIAIREARAVSLNLETTNGDIDVRGDLAAGAEQRLNSVNGDITLRLPADSNLRLEADTLSGDLKTTFTLRNAVRERRTLSGDIGAGGATLNITTVSGDVRVAADS